MVAINKIYTRSGDDGTTGLADGSRVSKADRRLELCGTLDELNSYIGLIRTGAAGAGKEGLVQDLTLIQHELFDLGAYFAKAPKMREDGGPITDEQIGRLEKSIDRVVQRVQPLRSFVLPGGTTLNAYLHIARTVCRRAERIMVLLADEEQITDEVKAYLNRLSDALFAFARGEAEQDGAAEYLWTPGTSRNRGQS